MSTILFLVAALGLIAANAFYVAAEFALLAVDRSQVVARASRGERPWPTVRNLQAEVSYHLAAAQVGITISSLIFGFLTVPLGRRLLGPVIDPFIGDDTSIWLTGAIAYVFANIFQVVLGEVVPKTVGIAEPMKVLRVLTPGIAAWGFVVRPIVSVLNRFADWIVSLVGLEPADELAGISSRSELEHVIRASGQQGTLDPEDVTRLTRTIRFADKTAGDILVPRVDLLVIDREDSLLQLCSLSVESGHSRFPVIGADTDDVLGVVHVKTALAFAPERRSDVGVEEHMTAAFVVPEARELDSLLEEMYRDEHHMAFVLDEHGGVAGIVTIEDIVEEIVGEIDDEYDESAVHEIERGADGAFVLHGGLHPDEVEEATGLLLPDGEYETLAGFALDRFQRIPAVGDSFDELGWTFTVTEMDRWRIARVQLSARAPTSAAAVTQITDGASA